MRIIEILRQLLRKVKMLKSNDKSRLTDLENEVNELKDEIDFLYNLLQPSPSISGIDNEDDGLAITTEIPAEIYDKIIEYCENKNFIFMGVA